MPQLIECVPNFSEGRDMSVIREITARIESIPGVQLLNVETGKTTNRTVVTFAGEPEAVIEAAFRAIARASEVIDMSKHRGEHPRFGATDVCPLVPVSGITMEETARYARMLGERVGAKLAIPVYLYEFAATKPERRNLATVRAGEYEGLSAKMSSPGWKPDYGPSEFTREVARSGATAIGARNFLVAYNINLNTTSVRKANSIAFDIREAGRVKRKGDPVTGKIVTDKKGNPVRVPGKLKTVKAIGWYIKEYGVAQISVNLTDLSVNSIHQAFDAACESAEKRGIRVTGSELIGLIPRSAMMEAGKHYLRRQKRSAGVPEKEIIRIAVKSLGLDNLAPFDPDKRIIEYMLRDESLSRLANLTVSAFADETASESPAPGGGSVAACVGALGASLASMVANISAQKRGWEKRWEEFSGWAEKAQTLKDELLNAVDRDTKAFNKIMSAYGLPRISAEEIKTRKEVIEAATREAIEVPLSVMGLALKSLEVIKVMARDGNPNSVSDAGVGALCAGASVAGAYLNVRINAAGLMNKAYAKEKLAEGKALQDKAIRLEKEILAITGKKIGI